MPICQSVSSKSVKSVKTEMVLNTIAKPVQKRRRRIYSIIYTVMIIRIHLIVNNKTKLFLF